MTIKYGLVTSCSQQQKTMFKITLSYTYKHKETTKKYSNTFQHVCFIHNLSIPDMNSVVIRFNDHFMQ